jgi:hypothetical protein
MWKDIHGPSQKKAKKSREGTWYKSCFSYYALLYVKILETFGYLKHAQKQNPCYAKPLSVYSKPLRSFPLPGKFNMLLLLGGGC